jgi:hypothetical protein
MINNETFDFSSNSAIEYLIGSKHFLEYPKDIFDKPEKTCYILDDRSLYPSHIQMLHKEDTHQLYPLSYSEQYWKNPYRRYLPASYIPTYFYP